MSLQSALQQQYPLNPRKFWKKIIQKLLVFIALSLAVAIPVTIFGEIVSTDSLFSPTTIGIVIFIFVFAFVFLPYAWYVKVYIRRYYYAGEENFITIKKGVFAPTEIHVQWQKIQDVYVDQDILDRIMGLYDVHIASATAASGIEAHIDGVDHTAAEGLKEFFLHKVAGTDKHDLQRNNSTQPPNQAQLSQSPVSTINLSEEISSNTYPLSGKWVVVALFGRFVSAFLLPIFIVFIFLGRFEDVSLLDYWVYLVLGWLALSILIMIIRTITLFLWKKNYAFNFTPEHIYFREGVISLSEKHMPYSSIQDVTVTQGVIERLFGLAKVVIQNAAQQPTIIAGRSGQQVVGFSGVLLQGLSLSDANKISTVLKTAVLGRNTSHYGL